MITKKQLLILFNKRMRYFSLKQQKTLSKEHLRQEEMLQLKQKQIVMIHVSKIFMENKFKVQNSFYIDSNMDLVIEGSIIQGIIKSGMSTLINNERYLCPSVDYALKSGNTSSNIIRISIKDKSKANDLINYLNDNPILIFQ